MLAKDLDAFEGTTPQEVAGRRAEEQMAFYLKRRFGDAERVWVFNGLRFERGGIYTQIDHFLLTRWGMSIVESKSVTTSVRINSRGEWMRLVDRAWKGMASPLSQATEQFEQLMGVLHDNTEALLSKLAGLQRRFGGFTRDIYCAVSDAGIIERERPDLCPEAMKADQVPGAIGDRLKQLKESEGLLKSIFQGSKKDPVITFTDEDLLRTKDFLLDIHRPQERSARQEQRPAEPKSSVLVLPGSESGPKPAEEPTGGYFCFGCRDGISRKVAQFCWDQKSRFGGKAYCMKCQRTAARD